MKKTTMFKWKWKLNSAQQFYIFSILYWINIKYRIVKQIFRNDFLNYFVDGDLYILSAFIIGKTHKNIH